MKAKTETTFKVTITLNEKEAKWLKDYTQNFLGQGKEPEEHKQYRYDLFNLLKDGGI